jgi:hypothetical protein
MRLGTPATQHREQSVGGQAETEEILWHNGDFCVIGYRFIARLRISWYSVLSLCLPS